MTPFRTYLWTQSHWRSVLQNVNFEGIQFSHTHSPQPPRPSHNTLTLLAPIGRMHSNTELLEFPELPMFFSSMALLVLFSLLASPCFPACQTFSSTLSVKLSLTFFRKNYCILYIISSMALSYEIFDGRCSINMNIFEHMNDLIFDKTSQCCGILKPILH